jgi:hypothetical protein
MKQFKGLNKSSLPVYLFTNPLISQTDFSNTSRGHGGFRGFVICMISEGPASRQLPTYSTPTSQDPFRLREPTVWTDDLYPQYCDP